MLDIYWKSLLFDAPIDFDAYCIYIEKNRPVDKRFYLPRRKRLIDVVSALQELEDDKLDLLGISLPPGAGKTTTALFFLTWLGGKHPEKPILSGSHSNAFLRGAYDECLRIMDPDGDYLFKDVFPDVKVIKTNAQDMMIDMGTDKKQGKRFATLEFSSVGSGNAGKVRAEQLLYCDDLVDGIEAAMSKERMDKLWQLYTTDLRQRKIGNCKELHIATRWSLHDVIGRLASTYEEDERSKFIVLPALDENDESNFDYGNSAGFTTKFYHQQREIMDDASWRALYMGQPIEREGQLYNEDELRRYFELPDGDPDAILSVCDTKDRGTDFCVMPIAYQYGNDFYIESIVCDNGNPETVENRLVSEMLHHNVHMSRFESNSAGGKVAEKIQKEIKAKNGRTKITTKFTTSNKETKIIVNSPFVKERFLFKDDSVLKNNKEYRKALGMLCGYTMAGKNKHDDVPDAFAMLAEFVQSLEKGRVEVFKRPF
jgi:predicted phage terminase large subunit-like protein